MTDEAADATRRSLAAAIAAHAGDGRGAAAPRFAVHSVARGQVVYDVGDQDRSMLIVRTGLIKVGAVTADGHELIYHLRRSGDVIGELRLADAPLRTRAIALEPSVIVAAPLEDVLRVVKDDVELLRDLTRIFARSLSEAYAQLHTVAFRDTPQRLLDALVRLGEQLGRQTAEGVEIPIYLTQEEIAQMVAVRRERASTAMNVLRKRGLLGYSRRGCIVLRPAARARL